MAEATLYPEGAEHLSIVVPAGLKAALRRIARERRLTLSQLCASILVEYVAERQASVA